MLIMKGPPCQDPRVCLATLPGLAPYPGGKYSDTLLEKMVNLQLAGGVLRRRPQVGKTATKLSLDLFNVRVDLRDGRVSLCLKKSNSSTTICTSNCNCCDASLVENKTCGIGFLKFSATAGAAAGL